MRSSNNCPSHPDAAPLEDLCWDEGRLIVKALHAPLWEAHGLKTFDELMSLPGLKAAKATRSDRVTFRFELMDAQGQHHVYYLKWHGRSPWKDWLKPWLQGKRPILGAHNEWQAMSQFEQAGIPSMAPVAFGRKGVETLVVIEGLEGYVKLSELIEKIDLQRDQKKLHEFLNHLASQTAKMHNAGLHHQDYYLGHLMVKEADWLVWISGETETGSARAEVTAVECPVLVHVIDLGRAQRQFPLKRRWIIKDLSQLNYSSRDLPSSLRMRFFKQYCHQLEFSQGRGLLSGVISKTLRIGRHTRKHRI